ncbi:hypothetical protein GN956_G17028 [Arapaima gigas]
MRSVIRLCLFVTWVVSRWEEVSSLAVLHLVPPGDSVALLCNTTLVSSVTWFHLQSENLTLLTVTNRGKLNNDILTDFIERANNLGVEMDNLTGAVSLIIEHVTESDLGLYYCARWHKGQPRFEKGVRLAFAGEGAERPLPVCWSLLVTVTPVAALLTAVAACYLCRRKDPRTFTCNTCTKGTERVKTMEMQYATLQLSSKTDPLFWKDNMFPPPNGVIYSSVANHDTASRSPWGTKVNNP